MENARKLEAYFLHEEAKENVTGEGGSISSAVILGIEYYMYEKQR